VERDVNGNPAVKPNNPFRFGMGYTDVESGLVYLRNRYLMPEVGRFITADPFWNLGNMQDGLLSIRQASNLYSFVLNNPIAFVDPSGLRLEIIGTPEQRDIIMAHLDQLTNDTLTFSGGGSIWRVHIDSQAVGINLPTGTSMLRQLISNTRNHLTTIRPTALATSVGATCIINASNPNVGSGGTVWINLNYAHYLNSNISGVIRSRFTPTHIALGHELIHAYRYTRGHRISGANTIEANGVTLANGRGVIPREEAETIGLDFYLNDGTRVNLSTELMTENSLRREQNRVFGMRLGMRVDWN